MASLAPNDRLHDWIARHRRVFALTGAGCSTASGIPDYRDATGEWKRQPPVMIQAFRTQDAVHRRYWARATRAGRGSRARAPNAAHRALAASKRAGTRRSSSRRTSTACTSARAAARSSICTAASTSSSAWAAAHRTVARSRAGRPSPRANPAGSAAAAIAPDGDADLDAASIESFAAPRCERVRRPAQARRRLLRRERAARSLRARVRGARRRRRAARRRLVADGLLGLPLRAPARTRPACRSRIVNRGRTRADDLAELKIEGDVGSTLTAAVTAIA